VEGVSGDLLGDIGESARKEKKQHRGGKGSKGKRILGGNISPLFERAMCVIGHGGILKGW